MRMSSGAVPHEGKSAVGWSSCGLETPRSSSTPATLSIRVGELRAHRGEPPVDQLKTRILERAIRMRRGVLIKSEKSSANTETGEDGRAVPAATKGPST
jgi:hypothetical protein